LLAEVDLSLVGDVVGHGLGHGFLVPLAPLALDGFNPLVESFGRLLDRRRVLGEIAEQVVAERLGPPAESRSNAHCRVTRSSTISSGR
jgi:hypothetical protein